MSFLEEIIERRTARVHADFGWLTDSELEALVRCGRESLLLADLRVMRERRDVVVVAEVKKASPSEGPIAPDCSAVEQARRYRSGGAGALSVLTEPEFFGGSYSDLSDVVDAVDLPVLCKDFIVDPAQLYIARACGADAVLLMVSVLGDRLPEFIDITTRLRIGHVVEVANLDELDIACGLGALAIAVNARDFTTLTVDRRAQLEVVREASCCCNQFVIAASGITNRADVEEAAAAGAHAVLVGTTLMRAERPEDVLKDLAGVPKRAIAS